MGRPTRDVKMVRSGSVGSWHLGWQSPEARFPVSSDRGQSLLGSWDSVWRWGQWESSLWCLEFWGGALGVIAGAVHSGWEREGVSLAPGGG